MIRKALKRIFWTLFFLGLLGLTAGSVGAVWAYFYFTRDLPNLASVEDYRPPAVSRMFARDGTLIAEFYTERRYPAKLSEVPKLVQRCFLAAEDASFYSHPGIDPTSILRAIAKNLESGSAQQGGSTITQQVVKNLLLTPEKKLTRKVKEAILSYRLEQQLTKDEILEIYLNQIFFGNNAYGIKAAARLYFHKELPDLTLAEGALLAGLPKAPSKYSPLLNMTRAKRRQRYVLQQMLEANFINADQLDEAWKEKVEVYPSRSQNIFHAPHYVTEVRRVLLERWKDLDIDQDGLEIHTALDLKADELASKALRRGLREVDKRRGWRGPISKIPDGSREQFEREFAGRIPDGPLNRGEVYPALVTAVSKSRETALVSIGRYEGTVGLKSAGWARKFLGPNDRAYGIQVEDRVHAGDVIEVSLPAATPAPAPSAQPAPAEDSTDLGALSLDQTPQIEGALVLVDPFTGDVVSLIGGYDYGGSQFNRVTQALRQPGSSFKPVLYLAAVDGFQYTPSTIVHDTPRTFRVGDQFWQPANFDEHFLGPITLRTALEKSRNLVSADIISRIGVDSVISYARKLGIESKLGRNLSLSLGSSEVTPLEMTRAYGVFPTGGVLFESTFVTKVLDRHGKAIFDSREGLWRRAKRVVSEASAFVMAHMMRGVIESGTGYKVKALGSPVGGKTGTSNNQMDTWFIGYTPHWVCGVWVGFDEKREIGPKETGGVVAAPIFLYFMKDFLEYREPVAEDRLKPEIAADLARYGLTADNSKPPPPLDFSPPPSVDPYWVNKASGLRSEPGTSGTIVEYFVHGTEPPAHAETSPDEYGDEPAEAVDYLNSPEL